MLKRDDPFTPKPRIGKRTRPYASPLVNKTPLRPKSTLTNDSREPSHLNDDVTEKRRTRAVMLQQKKNNRQALMSPVGASPKVSAIASPMTNLRQSSFLRDVTRTPIAKTTGSAPLNLSIGSAIKPPVPKLTIEQLNKTFEEWMKIAADNKINAKNSWNFALIDYFSELTFLREGDSINFQKASCTLDGCVKIYLSRVDSVIDATGKLLSGLDTRSLKNAVPFANDEEEDEMEDSEGAASKPKKRGSPRAAETLEKNIDNLSLKHFDLEFSVDPLFKKTCVEFGESGAHGSLVYSLGISTDGQVILDSTDAPLILAEDNEADSETDQSKKINIAGLTLKFGKELLNLGGRQICPTLKDYSFGDSSATLSDQIQAAMTKLAETAALEETDEDSYVPVDSGPDDAGYDHYDDGDHFVPQGAFVSENPTETDQQAGRTRPNAPNTLAARLITRDVHIGANFALSPSKDTFFSYLDQKMGKSWAGPEHWKVRPFRSSRPKENPIEAKDKASKKEFVLDFSRYPVDEKTLFAKGSATITINQSFGGRHVRAAAFASCLFGDQTLGKQTEITEEYWKEEGAGHSEGLATGLAPVANVRQDHYSDEDLNCDSGESDGYSPPELETVQESTIDADTRIHSSQTTVFGESLVSNLKTTQPLKIDFAKTAKRVDIKVLKDNIWGQISSSLARPGPSEPNQSTSPLADTAPQGFSRVIEQVSANYGSKEWKDISVPYCFICLLHLANENGLELYNNANDSELLIVQKASPELN